jgi:hypothetical protein
MSVQGWHTVPAYLVRGLPPTWSPVQEEARRERRHQLPLLGAMFLGHVVAAVACMPKPPGASLCQRLSLDRYSDNLQG